MSSYKFKTKDHPEADGRRPVNGDQEWRLVLPLEDGGTLTIHMGHVTRTAIKSMLDQEDATDTREQGVDTDGPI
jgi:hypothetical protein